MAESSQFEEREIIQEATSTSERNEVTGELVDGFFESDEYFAIKEKFGEKIRKNGSEPYKFGIRGRIFEQIALNYFYKYLKPDPENEALAEFLRVSLEDVSYHQVDSWLGDVHEEQVIMPSDKIEANPDALLVHIETDLSTGKKKAMIVGALDAKLSPVHKDEDDIQFEKFKKSLFNLVTNIKPRYATLMNDLGLSDTLPQDIDIVPLSELTTLVIKPQLTTNSEYTQRLTEEDIVIPITQAEIFEIYNKMVKDIMSEGKKETESKTEPVKSKKFDLRESKELLSKYDEDGKAEKFIQIWTKRPNEIDMVTLKVENDKITTISIMTVQGDVVEVPAHVFRSVFQHNIEPDNYKDPRGFKFKDTRGNYKYLVPESPENMARIGLRWESLVRKISVNGVRLGEYAAVRMEK